METNKWGLNKQVTLSVIVQIILLAGLIIGSWLNIQRQLDLLLHDVDRLLECQRDFSLRLEKLTAEGIGYEYRLKAVERKLELNDN